MSGAKLSPLQWRILRILAPLQPRWVLTGGGALAGFYLQHRSTRDLDLFWRGRDQLDPLPREVEAQLRAAGLAVDVLQSAVTFHRFRVSSDSDACVLDLVAEHAPSIEVPITMQVDDVEILVDSRQEILTSKLCALLGRCELRDLQDVKALIEAGASLDRALAEAPRKDGGFSPLTLAWVLEQFQVRVVAQALGESTQETDELTHFQRWLIEQLTAAGAPE